MDLDNVDPELILARGRYATVNGAYKDLMKSMQMLSQKACDEIRRGLQEESAIQFDLAHCSCERLMEMADLAAELKAQKDELYKAAWGK
jgi:hypothetical protein